jgi:transposase InsO family protein
MSTTAAITTAVKLNEHNYKTWALDISDLLMQLGLWHFIDGSEPIPNPPVNPKTGIRPDLATWDFQPESDEPTYLEKHERFLVAWHAYKEKKTKTSGTIFRSLEADIRFQFTHAKYSDPKVLWEAIKAKFETAIQLDGKYEMQKLATCKLEDYASVSEWVTAQDKIIANLSICDIKVTDEWRVFYLLSNLPNSPEWLNFVTSLEVTDKAKSPNDVITALEFFEAKLRRQKGIAPDAALFVTRKQKNRARGNGSSSNPRNDKPDSSSFSGKAKRPKVKCEGCGFSGHTRDKCYHPERWEAYAKKLATARMRGGPSQGSGSGSTSSPSQANLAAVDASPSDDSSPKESFLFAAFDHDFETSSSTSKPYESVFTVTVDALRASSDSSFTSSDWILDTGASSHITGNRQLFSSYKAYSPGEHLVRTASNQVVSAAGVGTVPIHLGRRTFLLRSVLHVPACGNNSLLSILQLIRKRMKINFEEDKATLTFNCRTVGTAYVKKDLFVLRCNDESATTDDYPVVFAAISARQNSKDILLWHARLGHLSLPAVKRACSVVEGMELQARSPSNCICEACILGKMSRRPFSKESGQRPVTRPLELIHTDVVGPIHTQSRKGFRYFIMFTDDATRYTYVYFLRHKSEATAIFKQFKAEVEKIHGLPIIRVRMDGGGEYSSDELLAFLRKEGIQVEPSAPYTPQQNGTSERCNRTVMDPARSMLKHAGMPNSFWADAVKVAVYIKNRLPTRALPDTTPFEAWHGTGKKPDLSHLRVFGSLAYAWTSPATRKKLDDRAKKAILIGYTATTQQYLLYDIASRREFLARDIQFNEGCLYSELLGSGSASSSVTFEIPDSANIQAAPSLPSVPAAITSTTADSESGDEASQQLQLEATVQPPSSSPQEASPSQPASPQHAASQALPLPTTPPRSTPGGWIDNDTESVLSDCPDPYAEPEVPRNLRINMHTSPPKSSTRTRSGRVLLAADTATAPATATDFMVEPGPKTYQAALKTPDAEAWTAAVNTEIAALDSHQALEFIPEELPQGTTIIRSRWLLSKKFKATGEIDKYKARLIAQGFTQKEGLDFDANAISSPVVDSSTIRLCLGLAAQHNLQIAILDCPTAFLGSTLHETIYLRLPEGNWQHRDPWKRDRPLVRLRKTLYGLKQSARGWFEDVYDFLVDNLGLTASVAAPGLFLGDGIIVLVYVDDIMILTSTIDKLTSICEALNRRFRAAPPKGASIPIGDHFQYVGLDVQFDRESHTVYINQSGYIAKVLEQFGMTNCRPRYTPMEEGFKLCLGTGETGEHPEPVDQSLYRQAIGSLLYIALSSRPDIAYAATTLGRFSSSPNSTHWTAVKHLLRYLRATAARKLMLNSIPSGTSIKAYADADLGGEKHTGKSTTGYILFVNGILVLWKSKKQTLVAQSTMEAELIASATVKKQIDWFRGLLSEIAPSLPASSSASSSASPLILNDNLACVTVLNSGNFKGENRHLRLRFYTLHEAVATGKLTIQHIPSGQMLADGLTKALGKVKHEKFVQEIGLV